MEEITNQILLSSHNLLSAIMYRLVCSSAKIYLSCQLAGKVASYHNLIISIYPC